VMVVTAVIIVLAAGPKNLSRKYERIKYHDT